MKIELADLVQIVALPLEIIGLTLTIIEVFSLERHNRLQRQLNRFTEKSTAVWYGKYNSLYFWSLFILSGIAFIIMAFAPEESLIQVVATFLLFGFIIWGFSSTIFKFLCVLLPGRNLLAFGITLSFVGVITEIYQVGSIYYRLSNAP